MTTCVSRQVHKVMTLLPCQDTIFHKFLTCLYKIESLVHRCLILEINVCSIIQTVKAIDKDLESCSNKPCLRPLGYSRCWAELSQLMFNQQSNRINKQQSSPIIEESVWMLRSMRIFRGFWKYYESRLYSLKN